MGKRASLEGLLQLRSFAAALASGLRRRFERGRLRTVGSLADGLASRTTYVTQTSLYGYLKTRMGSRYQTYFLDEAFSQRLMQSVIEINAVALGDAIIYLLARHFVSSEAAVPREAEHRVEALALELYRVAYEQWRVEMRTAPVVMPDGQSAFADRIAVTDLRQGASLDVFREGAGRLLREAPIADELKALDEEIVMRSVINRWTLVWPQVSRRLDAASVVSDYLSTGTR